MDGPAPKKLKPDVPIFDGCIFFLQNAALSKTRKAICEKQISHHGGQLAASGENLRSSECATKIVLVNADSIPGEKLEALVSKLANDIAGALQGFEILNLNW